MRAFFFPLFFLFASGPATDMGHLVITSHDGEVIFDLEIPAGTAYNLGLKRGVTYKFGLLDSDTTEVLFQNSFAQSDLSLAGNYCQWQDRAAFLAMGIARIRGTARCKPTLGPLHFKTPFLTKEAPDFFLAGTSDIPGFEKFKLTPKKTEIELGESSSNFPLYAVVAFLICFFIALLWKKKFRWSSKISNKEIP